MCKDVSLKMIKKEHKEGIAGILILVILWGILFGLFSQDFFTGVILGFSMGILMILTTIILIQPKKNKGERKCLEQ